MAIPSTTYDIATATNPSAALTDFTFIVDLSTMSAAWWTANNTTDGTRGRASKGDGTTELACDWIDFNNSAETGWLRVNYTGTLASSGTQELRIYPPNTANTAYGVSDTYGQYNAYNSAWLIYFPAAGGTDRTAGLASTDVGDVSTTPGKVGTGRTFDGTGDYVRADSNVTSSADITVLIWAYSNDQTAYVTHGMSGSTGYRHSQRDFDPQWQQLVNNGGAEGSQNISDSYQTWTHMAFSYDESVGDSELYQDGSSLGSVSNNTGGTFTDRVVIGDSVWGNGDYYNGDLNEYQLHTTIRATAWITEEFDQTNDNATFWGTWTNVPVGPTTGIAVLRRRMEDAA